MDGSARLVDTVRMDLVVAHRLSDDFIEDVGLRFDRLASQASVRRDDAFGCARIRDAGRAPLPWRARQEALALGDSLDLN